MCMCMRERERERESLPGSTDEVGEGWDWFGYFSLNLCVLFIESVCQNMKNTMHTACYK